MLILDTFIIIAKPVGIIIEFKACACRLQATLGASPLPHCTILPGWGFSDCVSLYIMSKYIFIGIYLLPMALIE